ncbi:copper homeostasis/adhesion lipoprotein NlpE [Superficieibacter electus]|uniref:Copper homeostasis/adhesion lipoprotein NlpE n=1 Tax=Superficieibacter electus TaxID=2022662 RepID=A0A2P5GMQ3_9ENTR|nr:envelope stress response activation lipoprotein NlpE [Superficieibacter electus]POP41644.1 copper homeostasis/adhesion lipoprotein NlpE [Superficieibacter electus]POP47073.1 copper homeostasis/adhesion lipoprotein NlpE [Superficieibacter electus]
MKKVILSAVAVWALVALIGCNHRTEVETVQPDLAELKPMQQSWRGVLPCADCEGIETSLFLEKDGSWVMNSHYLGAAERNSVFATYGTWARTADKLVLTDTQGEKYYYHAKGEALEMLDRDGNPITSQFNYTLEPVTASLPATPMAMRGMYQVVAGHATFTDCATEKTVRMRSVVPETGNRGEDKPVLLLMDGHFSLKTDPETREPVKVLTPDSKTTFVPGKGCKE